MGTRIGLAIVCFAPYLTTPSEGVLFLSSLTLLLRNSREKTIFFVTTQIYIRQDNRPALARLKRYTSFSL